MTQNNNKDGVEFFIDFVSDEPLSIIIVNEAHSDKSSLCTQRIRRLVNEIYNARSTLSQPDVAEMMYNALINAEAGLGWFRDNHPESVKECDYEMEREIDAAISAYEASKQPPTSETENE